MQEKYKNAALITYWLRDYINYLQNEEKFNPHFNIRYQHGQIVYVNFGYRIGSELGGCHYAIVLDVKNSRTNSQVIVIPMKSKRKKSTSYANIYHIDLKDEVYNLLNQCMKGTHHINRESVADAGQICTISKMRIMRPIKNKDMMAGICLSEKSMKQIEDKIRTLFLTTSIDENI